MEVDDRRFEAQRQLRHLVVEEPLPVGRQQLEARRAQVAEHSFELGSADEDIDVGEVTVVGIVVPEGREHGPLEHEEGSIGRPRNCRDCSLRVKTAGPDHGRGHDSSLGQRLGKLDPAAGQAREHEGGDPVVFRRASDGLQIDALRQRSNIDVAGASRGQQQATNEIWVRRPIGHERTLRVTARRRRSQPCPPDTSATLCLPALIHGIMARSFRPTFSMPVS
jgi:hypothetical protein